MNIERGSIKDIQLRESEKSTEEEINEIISFLLGIEESIKSNKEEVKKYVAFEISIKRKEDNEISSTREQEDDDLLESERIIDAILLVINSVKDKDDKGVKKYLDELDENNMFPKETEVKELLQKFLELKKVQEEDRVEIETEKVFEIVPDIEKKEVEKMDFDELAMEIDNIKSYISRAAGNDEQKQFGEYLGSLENEYKKREIADAKRERKEEFGENETEQLAREIGNISDRLKDYNVRPEYIESTRKEIEDYENKINKGVAFLTGALKDIYSRKSEKENESKDNYSLVQMKDQYIKLQEDIKNVKEQIDKIYKPEQSLGQQEKLEKIEKKVGVMINGFSKEEIKNILDIFNSEDEDVKVSVIKVLKERFSNSGLDLDDENVVKSITALAIDLGKKRLEEIETEELGKKLAETETETTTNSREVIQTVKETVREGQIRILGERIKALDVEGGNFEKAQTRLKVAEEKLRNFQDEEGMKEIIEKAHGSKVLSEDEAMKYKEYDKFNKAVSQESLGYALAYSRLLSSVDAKDIYEVAAEARRKSVQEVYGHLQTINGLIENQERIFGECDPKTIESVSRFKDAVLSEAGQEVKAGFTDLNKIKNVDEFNAMIPEIDKQLKSRAGKMPSNKKSSSKAIRNNLKDFAIISENNLTDNDIQEIVTDIKGLREKIKDKESDYAKYADIVLTVMEELIIGKGKRGIIEVISSDSGDEGENQRVSEMADFELIKIIHDKAGKKNEKKIALEISKLINNNSSALEGRDLESLIENEAVANKILNEVLVIKDSAFKMYVSGIIKEKIVKTTAEIKKLEEEKNAEFEGRDVFSANDIDIIKHPVGIESEDKIVENNVATGGNETAEVQPTNETISTEIQNVLRDKLMELKENDVKKFNNLPELIETFKKENSLFEKKFTKDWFRNTFSGNEAGYEELKDKKVTTFMAVLKKIYEEVEAENDSEQFGGEIDLGAEDLSKEIEVKNKKMMTKYLEGSVAKDLQNLLDIRIKSTVESITGGNRELQGDGIEEIIEQTGITMEDEDKEAMESLTFYDLEEVVEEILKTRTSELSSQGTDDGARVEVKDKEIFLSLLESLDKDILNEILISDFMLHSINETEKGIGDFKDTDIKKIEDILQKGDIELNEDQKSALRLITKDGLKFHINNILDDRLRSERSLENN